jgi:hypothetical protein
VTSTGADPGRRRQNRRAPQPRANAIHAAFVTGAGFVLEELDQVRESVPITMRAWLKKGGCREEAAAEVRRLFLEAPEEVAMARSRRPFVVMMSGGFSNACACFKVSQFPVPTPTDCALFTRAIPTASSGGLAEARRRSGGAGRRVGELAER